MLNIKNNICEFPVIQLVCKQCNIVKAALNLVVIESGLGYCYSATKMAYLSLVLHVEPKFKK